MEESSITYFYSNGIVKHQAWGIKNTGGNGLITYHRLNGPARIWYRKDGRRYIEQWWVNGCLHNTSHPSFIEHGFYSSVREIWFVNDMRLTEKNSGGFFTWLKENNFKYPYSDEDRMAIKLYLE